MKNQIQEIDVLIVGGGLSGTSTALSIQAYSNHSIMVVEQSDLTKVRVGEHVSSSIFNLIDYLKVSKEDFGSHCFLPSYETISYWGSSYPTKNHSIFSTENSTFQIDRQHFEFTLIQKFVDRGGVYFPTTKCRDFEQLEDSRWKVTIKHPNRPAITVIAAYLVDATGRNASVCRQLGVTSKKIDKLTAVGALISYDKDDDMKQPQLLESTELGWWYRALLPNKVMSLTFFSDASIVAENGLNKPEKWRELLQQTRFMKQLPNGTQFISPKPWIRNASTQITDTSSKSRFIAVGDAAVSYDPISSTGIGFSLTSACYASKHILNQLKTTETLSTDLYQNDLTINLETYLKLRKRIYEKEKRWKNAPFWTARSSYSNEKLAYV